MKNKKYKLLEDDTIVRDGRTLYRIEALRSVCFEVRKGEKGGYVESEANLSHEGGCWLYHDACAYENARVEGDAYLVGSSTLRGKAKLIEKANLWDHAIVQGEAIVGGESSVDGHVVIGGKAILKGWVYLDDDVHVGGNACLEGENPYHALEIEGKTMILGDTIMQSYGLFSEAEAILEAGRFRVEEDD